jgi:hypothetical protein
VNTTGWLKGLQVTADGTGIVSHAGVALLRALADNTGLIAEPWRCRRIAAASGVPRAHGTCARRKQRGPPGTCAGPGSPG